MFALLVAEQFAPFHDSHIEKVAVSGDPKTRACICESIVPRAAISQMSGKVGGKKLRAAQSVSACHAWSLSVAHSNRSQVRFGLPPIRRWCEMTQSTHRRHAVVGGIMKAAAVPRNTRIARQRTATREA